MTSKNGSKPEQAVQDLLALVHGRNQRIAELELQVLELNRNQCQCDKSCKKQEVKNAKG